MRVLAGCQVNAFKEQFQDRLDRDAQVQAECEACGRSDALKDGLCRDCDAEAAREWQRIEFEQQRDYCASKGV